MNKKARLPKAKQIETQAGEGVKLERQKPLRAKAFACPHCQKIYPDNPTGYTMASACCTCRECGGRQHLNCIGTAQAICGLCHIKSWLPTTRKQAAEALRALQGAEAAARKFGVLETLPKATPSHQVVDVTELYYLIRRVEAVHAVQPNQGLETIMDKLREIAQR